MERMKSASAKVKPVTTIANNAGPMIPASAASLIKRTLSIKRSTWKDKGGSTQAKLVTPGYKESIAWQ
jgi:hypothetical protein